MYLTSDMNCHYNFFCVVVAKEVIQQFEKCSNNGTLQKFSDCRSLFVWIGTPLIRLVRFSQIDVFVINVTVDHKNDP